MLQTVDIVGFHMFSEMLQFIIFKEFFILDDSVSPVSSLDNKTEGTLKETWWQFN